jgi:hypothetical protein
MEEKKELTVDQLKNYCDQLLAQRNELAQRLNIVSSITNKLPWLFKVIENKEYFSSEIVNRAIAEVGIILYPPQKEEKEEEKEEETENTAE